MDQNQVLKNKLIIQTKDIFTKEIKVNQNDLSIEQLIFIDILNTTINNRDNPNLSFCTAINLFDILKTLNHNLQYNIFNIIKADLNEGEHKMSLCNSIRSGIKYKKNNNYDFHPEEKEFINDASIFLFFNAISNSQSILFFF